MKVFFSAMKRPYFSSVHGSPLGRLKADGW